MTMEDVYYDYDKLLSRNDWIISFVVTSRGLGKTFGAKVAMLKHFLKTGEEFMYVRRYKTELDSSLATFWSDIQANGFFEDYDLKVKKNKILTKFTCNDKVCGYAVPLSTSNILKSTAFPKVKYIVFDEFLLPFGGTYRYLKNECTLFLDLMETTFRLRSGRVIMLGNLLNVYSSPYFAFWDLDLPYDSEFKSYKDGAILVHYPKSSQYEKIKKGTAFGKLIAGTDYERTMIENKDAASAVNFIKKKPPQASFYALLVINGVNIGVWYGRDGYLYMSNKFDPNTTCRFVFDFTDHTENTIFNSMRENPYMNAAVTAYKGGWLRFENQKVKANCISALNKCVSF